MIDKQAKTAFLFPGQGSQHNAMAVDFLETSPQAKELFLTASDILKKDMKKLITESDNEALKRTDIAQPAITLANLCAAAALGEQGIAPCAAAGHSLGDYAALVTAGVLSSEDCFTLVKARGEAMSEAAEHCPEGSGMAAVLGLSCEAVEQAVLEWTAAGLAGLYAANLNSPRQTVISGTADALKEAERRFKEAGAKRVVMLAVQGPFHSPLMNKAAEKFAAALHDIPFSNPKIAYFSNVTGAEEQDGEKIKKLAIEQILSPVRWTAIEAAISRLNINAALEAGPGNVLQGLWKDSGSAVPCHAAGSAAAIEKLTGN